MLSPDTATVSHGVGPQMDRTALEIRQSLVSSNRATVSNSHSATCTERWDNNDHDRRGLGCTGGCYTRPAHRRRAPCDRCRRSACRPSRRCHGARARRCRRRTALAHGRSKYCFPGPRVELADGGPGVSSMQSKSTRGCPWVCCPRPMVRATSLNVVHDQSFFAMSSREGSRATAGSCTRSCRRSG